MQTQPTYRIHHVTLHDESASWVAIVETAHTEQDMQQGRGSRLVAQRHIDSDLWTVLAVLIDDEPRPIVPRALDRRIGEALDARLAAGEDESGIPGTEPLAEQQTPIRERETVDVEREAVKIETQAQARSLTVTETAKLLRRALKARFRDVKFSVRSDSYAGGASIDVKWIDGPTEREVEQITDLYQGASFDGQTDTQSYHTSLLSTENGVEVVRFGADFVVCQRDYSVEFTAELLAEIEMVIGGPLDYGASYEAVIWDAEDGSEVSVRACAGASEHGGTLLHRLRHWRAR